ncbi:MAG TPA: GNAT family N-acyltransferase [Tepidisphaeraceae bacterium]
MLERLFALDGINGIYDHCAPGGAEGFFERALDYLKVAWRVNPADLASVPAKGPLVVVANHPFGAIEGMVLAALLRKVRPDVRVMANFLLGRVPELRDLFICVDPFGGGQSSSRNLGPMRQALRWLGQGGVLAVFPAGEVAHLDLKQGGVVEPRWSETIAGLVRRSGAPVLPVYFDGSNGPLFHLLGLVHPRLRTAMLPRQLMNKCGQTLDVRIGAVIPSRRLAAIEDDAAMAEYLRERMLLLRHRVERAPGRSESARAHSNASEMEPIVAPSDPQTLATEVANLPGDQLLTDGNDFRVCVATARQAPTVLREIGRLREITYRATGEGTGKSIDLDPFDGWYQHLFLWDVPGRQVVGAYRLGCSDEILRAHGPAGLYTSTLFDYKPELLARLNPALELGRAFVRAEFQKSYAPLLSLWKGIARFVSLNPRYKTLFGPVSISNDYQLASRQLMVDFLRSNHLAPDLIDLARARNPFPSQPGGSRRRFNVDPADIDDVVADLEPDRKGVPVLLRQYLKLGARFFSFNVDAGFGNAIDALMLVDLTQTDERILDRYMGKEAAARFRAFHRSIQSHQSPVMSN